MRDDQEIIENPILLSKSPWIFILHILYIPLNIVNGKDESTQVQIDDFAGNKEIIKI